MPVNLSGRPFTDASFHFQLDGFSLSVVYELKQGRSVFVLQMESNRVVTLDCTDPNQLLVFLFNFQFYSMSSERRDMS